ncbi:hypothetical protein KBB12_04620 [Candidatus Woesebacteria bacterium]|nr:hypothetical protein [Candidatus Woesebacteria bacterium]
MAAGKSREHLMLHDLCAGFSGAEIFNMLYTINNMKNDICKNGNIHLIGIQKEFRTRVEEAIRKGLDGASALLTYNDVVDIAVFDSEEWDIHSKLNLSAHARVYYIDIKICFYKNGLDLDYLFNVDLPATIYHELSHVVRANTIGYAENLLQDIIDEGIACYVEEYSGLAPKQPYVRPIRDEEKYIEDASKHFQVKLSSDLHSKWFYGSGNLPEWIGYRIGYLMVKKYIEANKIGIDQLVRSKAEIIAKF